MTDLKTQLRQLLAEGLAARLYSGAAAAVVTPEHSPMTVTVGTHSYHDQTSVSVDSLFDLASVTKTIVAAAVVSLIEEGLIEPDEPVAPYLAVGSGPGANSITLRQLLTHTAGLPANSFVWKDAHMTEEGRLTAALTPLLESAPDTIFRYSCLGYIAAGKLAEKITGKPLDSLVAERITAPLNLKTMTFGPVSAKRALATENESYIGRGQVHGEVHDELAWSLGSRVGNAGIFASASDLLAFARMFLQHERSNNRAMHEEGLRLMSQSTLRPEHGTEFGHGMGLRIADPNFMGKVNGIGHTGFTGTMLMIDPERDTAAVLLTNRVNPSRNLVNLNPFRIRFNTIIAAASTQLSGGCGWSV